MNIGEVAARSGVPAKTIRYYEEVGLIRAAPRGGNGYRAYDEGDLHVLRFVQRARSLGFGVEDCRRLLALWQDPQHTSAEVKALALRRIGELDRKLRELEGMRATLVRLAEGCHGDARPECPILDDLAQGRPNPDG